MSYLRSYNTKNQPLDPNLISWFFISLYFHIFVIIINDNSTRL